MSELRFIFGSVYRRVSRGVDNEVRIEMIKCGLD
jgi:hypothetical protein